MRQLFGTDGIRARAGAYPLDDATMWALGKTLATRLAVVKAHPSRILLGMDTRESGPSIARALAAGICAGGGMAQLIGVIPTPGVAFLCRSTDADAGVSISASHNPYEDNGVKIFGTDGMKLSDALEKQIEDELLAFREGAPERVAFELNDSPELLTRYVEFLDDAVAKSSLVGKKVILDAGNGASYQIAANAFAPTGADIIVMNDRPDGRNINADAGALHPEALAERVVREGAIFGVAFDGDADRAIFVDDKGKIRDGDEILFLWAMHEKRRGRLRNDIVVATVMSNLGFERKLQEEGIRLLRASVGDKYVLELMITNNAVLGGEQSGHLIDLQVHTTGDGLHTALAIADLLSQSDRPFSELATFVPMPQILKNEKVAAKPPLAALSRYNEELVKVERELGSAGRVLVRYSGTENMVRVMIEGDDQQKIEAAAARLCSVLREEIAAAT